MVRGHHSYVAISKSLRVLCYGLSNTVVINRAALFYIYHSTAKGPHAIFEFYFL